MAADPGPGPLGLLAILVLWFADLCRRHRWEDHDPH
jgi:hypothetical protein